MTPVQCECTKEALHHTRQLVQLVAHLTFQAMENATANCSFPTVEREKTVVILYAVFAAIAFLSHTATIIIIVWTKTYNLFLHRLILYLTIGGMLRTMAYVLQVLPVNIDLPDTHPVTLREGWKSVCVLGAFMIHYSPYFQTFIVLWTCYLIQQVVRMKRLNKISLKGEVVGVSLVILAPLLFTW